MSFLHPYESLDTLGRYSKISPYLYKFLSDRELAAKIIGPNFTLLKRGTKLKPLFIQDLKEVDQQLLQRRSHHHLKEVTKLLTPKQVLLRQYFFPRKMVNFFYACNHEYGNSIDRIFIDIDRQDLAPQLAQKVTLELINIISDISLPEGIKHKIFTMRTGSSFHIYLNLDKPVNHDYYDTYFSYGIGKEDSLITKRASIISQKTGINTLAGHERRRGVIILDTSNTPPGKLARCPFSIHIKNPQSIDGIAIPLTKKDLENNNLIDELNGLVPELVREKIDHYSNLINISLW